MSRHFLALSIFLHIFGTISSSKAAAPAAPSNFKVTPVGVNSFKLKWKDNSDNETGWDVLISLAGGKPQHYAFIPIANINSYTIFTPDLPGYGLIFQLAAYNGKTGEEVLSDVTPSVAVRALAPSTFDAPTGLTAKTLDDNRIRLSWTDNSTSESGYQIQIRPDGEKKWVSFATVEANVKFKVVASRLIPSKKYSFRVRAYKGDGAKYSKFSNIAAAKTKVPLGPDKFVAIPKEEASFIIKWRDHSNVETGFELQKKVGDGSFKPYLSFGGYNEKLDTLKATLQNLELDADLGFRVRAVYQSGSEKSYSNFSNTFSVRSTKLNAPTGLDVQGRTEDSISLKWDDNSGRESGYRIEYRKTGTTKISSSSTGSGAESTTVSGLDPGQNYQFRVQATESTYGTSSLATEWVSGKTREAIKGNLAPVVSLGVAFNYQIQVTSTALLTNLEVTGLPASLVFNPANRTITGTLFGDASYDVTVTATFSDGSTSVRTLKLRTIAPPVATAAFDAQSVAVSATKMVSVTGKFNDPDTESAARFETTKGPFDIILFSTATPLTVANFLDYIDAGKYDDSFFHRSPDNFVVQGGGYKYKLADGFTEIVKLDPVLNEPGISNLRGTVAMAKIGGQPNSATSEWFVNIKDNSGPPPALDTQNGGFTVFGRVPESGMTLFQAINDLPVATYEFPFSPDPKTLDDVPVDAATAPPALDPTKLVKIITVGPAPILSYTVTSLNSAIATASISGTDITISGVATGSTSIEVKATDLDGQSVTENIAVTVP